MSCLESVHWFYLTDDMADSLPGETEIVPDEVYSFPSELAIALKSMKKV